MAIIKPSPKQLREAADAVGLNMTEDDLAFHAALLEQTWQLYDILDDTADELPAMRYPRAQSQPALPEENIYNAWYVQSEIKGAPTGPLAAYLPISRGSGAYAMHIPPTFRNAPLN